MCLRRLIRMVQDPRKFRYSSDYPQPLIGFRAQYTVSVSQDQSVARYQFKHNLPYTPLLMGKYSNYSDFRVSYDTRDTASGMVGFTIYLYSDETYITVIIASDDYTSPATAYVKVLGVIPPDYAGSASILPSNTNFTFNTDKNYMQVYKQASFTPGQSPIDIQHNLGYRPQCSVWVKVKDRFRQNGGAGPILYEPVGFSNDITSRSYSNKVSILATASDHILDKGYYQIYTSEA